MLRCSLIGGQTQFSGPRKRVHSRWIEESLIRRNRFKHYLNYILFMEPNFVSPEWRCPLNRSVLKGGSTVISSNQQNTLTDTSSISYRLRFFTQILKVICKWKKKLPVNWIIDGDITLSAPIEDTTTVDGPRSAIKQTPFSFDHN